MVYHLQYTQQSTLLQHFDGRFQLLNSVLAFDVKVTGHVLRPTLCIPRADDHRASAAERAIDLDGFFDLHPALRPLLPAFYAGHLAVVHACGAPDESRSHFKAMELMERGVTDELGPASGWISRHPATMDTGNPSPLPA